MNRKMLASCAALALVLGFSSLAEAGCSPEEAQQKALAFSQVIQEESQKNPETCEGHAGAAARTSSASAEAGYRRPVRFL